MTEEKTPMSAREKSLAKLDEIYNDPEKRKNFEAEIHKFVEKCRNEEKLRKERRAIYFHKFNQLFRTVGVFDTTLSTLIEKYQNRRSLPGNEGEKIREELHCVVQYVMKKGIRLSYQTKKGILSKTIYRSFRFEGYIFYTSRWENHRSCTIVKDEEWAASVTW